MENEKIYIQDVAEILDRRVDTLRKWDREKILPEHLLPERGERNHRFWYEWQVEQIKDWIRDTDRRPGKAILSRASEDHQRVHRERMRQPKSKNKTILEARQSASLSK